LLCTKMQDKNLGLLLLQHSNLVGTRAIAK
jgi:hypothetical protein